MKIVCIIPARANSTRFPRKVFAMLGKHTLLGNVIERAKKVSLFDDIYVAACSEEVAQIARDHGVKVVTTDPMLENGTDRITAAIEKEAITGDIFVNWQADEPFINETMIKELLSNREGTDIWTLKKKIDKEEANEPSIVKVVTGYGSKALYFSRSLIPYQRGDAATYFQHIGLYAYTGQALDKIASFQKTPLETSEVLEQLRWLENGLQIRVNETSQVAIGIDIPEDLYKANLKACAGNKS
ncbi:MAG: 3-deoxy-manno-octulosonate cytidylyltransferase [Chlamydiia bacterium]|nr:3-deoxy-manno-octulosonate cytidylyltransferase [Chlamydiia bacterium]MCH9618570.1 3-deoxy-manno-octulosonate cytidylyltransferase [Chlamydiia bacterium]MCH9623891.1 3-deoxy-manno-octulosonate cytidylyltransferase [Chlamydiia bacterium]